MAINARVSPTSRVGEAGGASQPSTQPPGGAGAEGPPAAGSVSAPCACEVVARRGRRSTGGCHVCMFVWGKRSVRVAADPARGGSAPLAAGAANSGWKLQVRRAARSARATRRGHGSRGAAGQRTSRTSTYIGLAAHVLDGLQRRRPHAATDGAASRKRRRGERRRRAHEGQESKNPEHRHNLRRVPRGLLDPRRGVPSRRSTTRAPIRPLATDVDQRDPGALVLDHAICAITISITLHVLDRTHTSRGGFGGATRKEPAP